jgi:ABC-type bacteriocin/lantibiotic exporter with double-glycine peptidase domain
MLETIKKGFTGFIKLLKDTRAEASKIISISVALLIAGVLLPVALSQIYSANTTGWNTAVALVFTVLLPVLAVIAIALIFFKGTR